MNLPSGEYEIPLVLQDRTLNDQGQLVYAPTQDGGVKLPRRNVGAATVWGIASCKRRDLSVFGCRTPPLPPARAQRRECAILQSLPEPGRNPTDIPTLVTISSDRQRWRLSLAASRVTETAAGAGGARRSDRGLFRTRGQNRNSDERCQSAVSGMEFDSRSLSARCMSSCSSAWACPLASDQMSLSLAVAARRGSIGPGSGCRDARLRSHRAHGCRKDVRWECRSINKDTMIPLRNCLSSDRWKSGDSLTRPTTAHPMHLHLVQFQILERQGFDYGAFLKGSTQIRRAAAPACAKRGRMEGHGDRESSRCAHAFWCASKATPDAMFITAMWQNMKITT